MVFAQGVASHETGTGIWRFEEIGASAKAPIGDPDFLDAMAKSMKKSQEEMRSMMPTFALQTVNSMEAQYQQKNGTYSCSASELDKSFQSDQKMIESQVKMLKDYAYELKLNGCSSAGYRAALCPPRKLGKHSAPTKPRRFDFLPKGMLKRAYRAASLLNCTKAATG